MVAVIVAVALVLAWLRPLDGYEGLLLESLAAVEDTVYSSGYSEKSFATLRVGMTERQVSALLGEPLELYTVTDDGVPLLGWKYSRCANDHSYRVRCVLFREGRVDRIIHHFYLD